jgi:hypothetical protein
MVGLVSGDEPLSDIAKLLRDGSWESSERNTAGLSMLALAATGAIDGDNGRDADGRGERRPCEIVTL